MTANVSRRSRGPGAWDLMMLALAAPLVAFAVILARAILSAQPLGIDFLPMWTGARIAAQDPARLYDAAAVTQAQHWLLGGLTDLRPFPYPPSALLVFGPLARLPFWPAYWIWTGLGLAAFLTAGLRLGAGRPWLAAVLVFAAPAAVSGMLAGQSVFLIGGLVMAAIPVLDRRPILAGLLLGVAAAIKPSLLIAAPILLAVGGHWRALLSSIAAGSVMIAASALTYGVGPWQAWIGSAEAFEAQVLGDARLLKMVVSPAGPLRQIGVTGPLLLAVQLVCALIVLALAAAAFRRESSARLRLITLLGAGLMATPYAMNYDTVLLAPAAVAGLLGASAGRQRMLALAAFAALLLAGFPFVGGVALALYLALEAGRALAVARAAS